MKKLIMIAVVLAFLALFTRELITKLIFEVSFSCI